MGSPIAPLWFCKGAFAPLLMSINKRAFAPLLMSTLWLGARGFSPITSDCQDTLASA